VRERLAALIQEHAHVPKRPPTTYSGGDIGARLLTQAPAWWLQMWTASWKVVQGRLLVMLPSVYAPI